MEFKYQIGQTVILRTSIADCMAQARAGEMSGPRHAIITERLTQECCAGVQLFYLVHLGMNDPQRLPEAALALPEEFDAAAAIEAAEACEEARRRQRHDADAKRIKE